MKQLRGKNVLITGAAAGIGRLMAHEFARKGSNVALLDIDQKLLKRTEKEMVQYGVKIYTGLCDVSSEQKVAAAAKSVKKNFGDVDVLVNNAGIVTGKSFLDLSLKEFRKTMDVNFMGTVMMTRQFLPAMVGRNRGSIVNIASSAGLLGMPSMSDYCASKFADVGFSDSLRLELKQDRKNGVKITIVCPYVIDTGMFNGFKPLMMNPMIKPEYVARKVVAAVQKGKPYLYLPPVSVGQLRVFLLLPKNFLDRLLLMLGAGRAMESFKGSMKK